MSRYYFIFAILLIAGFAVSEPKHVEAPDYIAVVRDTSGSREVTSAINQKFLENLGNALMHTSNGKHIELYDLTSKTAQPLVVDLEPVPKPLPAYDNRYNARKKAIQNIREHNQKVYSEFVGQAIAVPSDSLAYRYSYLHKNLKVVLPNLTDTFYQNHILLLETDLKDDPKGQSMQLLSGELTEQLNRAIQKGAMVFLSTETDRSIITDSIGLEARPLAHPDNFIKKLNRFYNNTNIPLNYEQQE